MVLAKSLYGLLKSTLLFHLKLWKYLNNLVLKGHPYSSCVAKSNINGKHMTVACHADDPNISHIVAKIITWVVS